MRSLKVTPNLITLDEFVSNTTTFSLSDYNPTLEEGTYYIKFFNVSANEGSFIVTPISLTSFSIATTFVDVFTREVGYVKDKTSSTVNGFSLLPSSYDAIYKFINSSEIYRSIYYTVNAYYGPIAISSSTVPNTTVNIEYYVRNNWEYLRTLFTSKIADGAFTKQAIAAGKY